jgi:outer membrane biogenesis lipoprotein LolB
MVKTLKNLILIVFASFVLIACSQQGGSGHSKKSKTLENKKKDI